MLIKLILSHFPTSLYFNFLPLDNNAEKLFILQFQIYVDALKKNSYSHSDIHYLCTYCKLVKSYGD